ncbi:hypothetical protein [Embleya sp. NPDC055610]
MAGEQSDHEPMCFDRLESALEGFAHELRDTQSEFWYDRCERVHREGSDSEWCECPWCDLAATVEAVLAAIADGDVAYALRSHRSRDDAEYTYAVALCTPDGPDACHWITVLGTTRTLCVHAD